MHAGFQIQSYPVYEHEEVNGSLIPEVAARMDHPTTTAALCVLSLLLS